MQMPSKSQIVALTQSGRLTEAKAEGIKLCKQSANDPEAWLLLAGIHAQLGELNQVAECCQRAVALQPGNVMALFNLGVAQQMAGRFEEAAHHYREALDHQPDLAQAHSNLGVVLRELGQHDTARSHCEQAVRLNPGFAQAHNNLGLCLKETGHAEQAQDAFGVALRLNPGLAEAHYNLGLCHLAAGRPEPAAACFEEALRCKPDYADACRNLGQVLMSQQQHERAATVLERLTQIQPDDAEAHNSLGGELFKLQKFHEAQRCFRRVIALKPDYAVAHHNLGLVLDAADGISAACLDEAEQCYRSAVRQKPDFAEAYCHLGTCLVIQQKFDQARHCFERALAIKPDYEQALAALVMLEEQVGRIEQAVELLSPALERGASDSMLTMAYAKVARHTDERDKAIEALDKIVAGNASPEIRKEAHFALGRLLEEQKQYDRAFEHYRRANDLDQDHHDSFADVMTIDKSIRSIDKTIAIFSADNQARRPRASNRSRLPLFIVGMPRSGTTLVEQILASHPLVHGAGELRDMERLVTALPRELGSRAGYPACVNDFTRLNLDKQAQRYLDRLGQLAMGKSRVTDKMPHNFLHLGLIDLLFPEARVIHCTRDPVDTCLSIYFHQFNRFHFYATQLELLGLYYRQYRRLMRHWQGSLRIPIMEINYEKLVSDFEPQCRSLIEFCGLEWDERCLSFHTAKRTVGTLSYDQVRRPLYTTSVARWKRYEKHLGPLLTALGDEIQTTDIGAGTAPATSTGS